MWIGTFGRQFAGQAGNGRANAVQVDHVFQIDLSHERPSVRDDGHQALALEDADRLPDRTATDAQLRRQRDLVEPLATGQATVHDHRLEPVGHQVRQCAAEVLVDRIDVLFSHDAFHLTEL